MALWAFFLALFAIVVAAGTADASGGGVSAGGSGGSSKRASASNSDFGDRPLRKGDRGDDVKTLNWILRALPFAGKVSTGAKFNGATDQTVRKFQKSLRIGVNGVVNKKTRKKLLGRMPTGGATYYGPGLYGNRTACGQILKKSTIGVANNSLPCGAKVAFAYKNRVVRATVIDRIGNGLCWDLTSALKKKLRFPGSGSVRYAAAGRAC